jgi:hypothetical protein
MKGSNLFILKKTVVNRWIGSLAGVMSGSKGPPFSRRRESSP